MDMDWIAEVEVLELLWVGDVLVCPMRNKSQRFRGRSKAVRVWYSWVANDSRWSR